MGIASPLSTGGAGPDFETEVRVSYLVALLAGSVPRGAAGGVTSEVLFQQAAAGAPLDDVTVKSRRGSGETATLELQVKHRFTFAPSDTNFSAIIRACWDTFMRPDFRVPGNRLGVAAGHYPERVRSHYVRVPAWANTSTSATHFFDRITTQGLASNVMRDFVANVRTGLESYAGEISDQLLWEFFCHLIILEFDFGNEGSRDRHFALETLRGLVSNHDSERSQLLYGQLVDLASTAGHTAGGYTSETLRKRLVGSGLLAAPACQRDLERLEALSQRTLSSIDHSVGGVVLDRTAASTDLLNRMERGGVIVLVGDAGVGKSALLRTAALARAPEGSVVALSLVRLEQIVGWEGLASRLQLDSTLDQLILSMSGTARPCLLIDGVDRIEAQGERAAVNDVLRVITRLPRAQDGSWVWSIILTTRGETLHAAQEWLDLQITRIIYFVYPNSVMRR